VPSAVVKLLVLVTLSMTNDKLLLRKSCRRPEASTVVEAYSVMSSEVIRQRLDYAYKFAGCHLAECQSHVKRTVAA
jgi:hypothetical protein